MADKNIQMHQKTGEGTYDDLFPVTTLAQVKFESGGDDIQINQLVFEATSCSLSTATYTIVIPQLLNLSTLPTRFIVLVDIDTASPATADIDIKAEGGGSVLMSYSLYVNESTQIGAGDIQPGTTLIVIDDTANKAFVMDDANIFIKKSFVTAKGQLIGASASGSPALVTASSTDGQKLVSDSAQASGLKFIDEDFTIQIIIGDGTNTIPTGVAGGLEIPVDCTVEGWTCVSLLGVTGSITVDVWYDTYANFPPTVADTIAGSEKPRFSSATKGQDLSLSSWSTSLSKGGWLLFNVDSATTVKLVCVSLRCRKTATS